MAKQEVNTRKGEHVAVFMKNVAVVFKRVIAEGVTTVEELDTGPEPRECEKIVAYYSIKTNAEYEEKLKIRIILPYTVPRAKTRKLLQWNKEEECWKELESKYYPEYHYLIGKTEHISVFGVI